MSNMDGFDEIMEKMEEIKENAQKMDGHNNVPSEELFNETFMKKYTEYSSIYEMIEDSNSNLGPEEILEEEQEDQEWNEFVEANSVFDKWEDMRTKAGIEWTAKGLGF